MTSKCYSWSSAVSKNNCMATVYFFQEKKYIYVEKTYIEDKTQYQYVFVTEDKL